MNVNEVEVSAMERDWEAFLAPYEQTVSELKVKLRGSANSSVNKIDMSRLNLSLGESSQSIVL